MKKTATIKTGCRAPELRDFKSHWHWHWHWRHSGPPWFVRAICYAPHIILMTHFPIKIERNSRVKYEQGAPKQLKTQIKWGPKVFRPQQRHRAHTAKRYPPSIDQIIFNQHRHFILHKIRLNGQFLC